MSDPTDPIDEAVREALTNRDFTGISALMIEALERENRRLRWTTAVSTIISVAAVLFATLVLLGRLP
jgi:hypothetical protein